MIIRSYAPLACVSTMNIVTRFYDYSVPRKVKTADGKYVPNCTVCSNKHSLDWYGRKFMQACSAAATNASIEMVNKVMHTCIHTYIHTYIHTLIH